MVTAIDTLNLRRFTVDEYHCLGQAGVFAPEERVELIRGVIRKMSPKGKRHVIAVAKANRIFTVGLTGKASVLIQDPLIKQGWHSEPEPDLVLMSNPDLETYGTEDSSVLLVIEVADSSLDYDRTTKAPLYAEAGIPEYWIVNLAEDRVEIYRNPSQGRYRDTSVLEPGSRIAPLAWPDLRIDVSQLIPAPASESP